MTAKKMMCVQLLEEQTFDSITQPGKMTLVPLYKATLHEQRELSRVEWWSNERLFTVGKFYKVAITESEE